MEPDDVPGLVGEVFRVRKKAGSGKGKGKGKDFFEEGIDLKREDRFVGQYVQLRNSYVDLLLTSCVGDSETREWLKNENVEARGIVRDDVLAGVVILYMNKGGEIAFFAKERNRGIGSRLLALIEGVARKRKLEAIWGWVLEANLIAQRVFEKSGFVSEGMSEREYEGIVRRGVKYTKYL